MGRHYFLITEQVSSCRQQEVHKTLTQSTDKIDKKYYQILVDVCTLLIKIPFCKVFFSTARGSVAVTLSFIYCTG